MEWYKSRRYLHFDPPIGEAGAKKVVSAPTRVASHSFYPFIRYVVKSQKVHFDKAERKVKRKEPKERPISYAAHLDSHIYSYYCSLLSDHYEKHLSFTSWSDSVLAFRAIGKSNIEFARDAFQDIASRRSCCAITIDIKGFFDNINHQLLKESWQRLLRKSELPPDHYSVYKSLTRFSYVERDPLFEALGIPKSNPKRGRTRICSAEEFRSKIRKGGLIKRNCDTKGIPQGSPISSLLSNIYMFEFDERISVFASCCGGSYYRYCDDILLIVPIEKAEAAKTLVSAEVTKVKLELQESKTEIIIFRETPLGSKAQKPLQYLGFTFDGTRIHLRSSSLARYQERVNRGLWLARKSMEKVNGLRMERGELPRALYLKKIYKRYSHLGRRNFISYGYRAASIMRSSHIRKQLKPNWQRLREKISDANA